MLTSRLLEYMAAYERSYADDDWTRLEPFFSEDAVHQASGGPPLGGRWQGRAAVIASLRERAEAFDRRFDERILSPRGVPVRMGDTVALPWRGIYRLERDPSVPLTIEGTKVATFASDQIELLHDQLRPGTDRLIHAFLQRHPVIGGRGR
jgi:hypothetical protein